MWSENQISVQHFAYNVFGFTTHTLGSNSTATLGTHVLESIIFAVINCGAIAGIACGIAVIWRFITGKRSKKCYVLTRSWGERERASHQLVKWQNFSDQRVGRLSMQGWRWCAML